MDPVVPLPDAPPPENRQFPRLLGLIVASALVAALTLAIMEWHRSWDNPPYLQNETIAEGQFLYLGNPVSVEVRCVCPKYFLQGQTRDLHLTFTLRASSVPGKTSAAPAEGHAGELTKPAASSIQDLSASPATSEADVWGTVDNGVAWKWWNRDDAYNAETIALDNRIPAGVSNRIDAVMSIASADGANIRFYFGQWDNAAKKVTARFDPDGLDWRPEVRPFFWNAIAPFAVAAIVFLVLFIAIFMVDYRFRQLRRRTATQLAQVQNEPHSAWETARIKLEAYLDRNLIQVNLVFWVAVFVMLTGFSFVLAGIYILFRSPGDLSWVKALPAISGLITQFIGATFMVIYRSTMSQANDFMSVLERINTVGMAVHELDRIPDEEKQLKNDVRARLVELLIGNGRATISKGMTSDRARAKSAKKRATDAEED